MKPSNHWLANLILLIQECHAENDMSFVAFIESLTWGEGDSRYDDYKMVQKLKALQESNFKTVGIDGAAQGGDYTVITPATLIDEEKSLNES